MTDDTRLIWFALTYDDMPVGFRFRTMRRTITAWHHQGCGVDAAAVVTGPCDKMIFIAYPQ